MFLHWRMLERNIRTPPSASISIEVEVEPYCKKEQLELESPLPSFWAVEGAHRGAGSGVL